MSSDSTERPFYTIDSIYQYEADMKNIKNEPPKDERLADLLLEMSYRCFMAKTALCEVEPMTDAPALLINAYETSDDGLQIGFLPLMDSSEINGQTVYYQDDSISAISNAGNQLPARKFKYIISALEAFGVDRAVVGEEIRDEKIQDDFENNPFSPVRQNITFTAIDWGVKNVMICVMHYGYCDKGLPDIQDVDWYEFPIKPNTDMNGFHTVIDALSHLTSVIKQNLNQQTN